LAIFEGQSDFVWYNSRVIPLLEEKSRGEIKEKRAGASQEGRNETEAIYQPDHLRNLCVLNGPGDGRTPDPELLPVIQTPASKTPQGFGHNWPGLWGVLQLDPCRTSCRVLADFPVLW
jgi:hypothetical protein